jgi:hypothetical protein
MKLHLEKLAFAAALAASLGGIAAADELNPQPLPPGPPPNSFKLSDGRSALIGLNRVLLLGTSRTPAAAGRYTLADRSIIIVGGKGQILSRTSPLSNRFTSPGSKSMLNPQPLPP